MDSITHPKRILLAEDNLGDVYLVKLALSEHQVNGELQVITDGEALIHFLRQLEDREAQRSVDILLLDVHLPKRDGLEVLTHLRSSPRWMYLPVVVLTSSDSPHIRQAAEMHVGVKFFRKPSSLREFMELGAVIRNLVCDIPGGAPATPCAGVDGA